MRPCSTLRCALNTDKSVPANSSLAMERESRDFIPTADLDEAKEVMDEQGWVILCGPPGSGKTTTGNAILRYCAEQGFGPCVLSDLKDWHVHVGEGRWSAVLMDGTLGEVGVDKTQYQQWRSLVNSLLALIEGGHCRLVLTIYPHVLRKLRDFDEGTASPLLDRRAVVQLMHARLDDDEKMSLLRHHLARLDLEPARQQQLTEEILQHDVSGSAFLWCCRQLLNKWMVLTDPAAIFTAPAYAYVPLLKRLLDDKPLGSECIAAVLALSMLGVKHFINEKEIVRTHLQRLDFSSSLSVDQLAECADSLKGLVLDPHGEGVVSRTLYEAAGLALGHSFRLPLLLTVCDSRFLAQYVQSRETTNGISIILVSETETRWLYERLLKEIRSKQLQQASQHPTLRCERFLRRFLQETEQVKCDIVSTLDGEHNMPLLYWAVVGQSTALINFCLDHLSLMDIDTEAMETLLTQIAFAMALLWDDSGMVLEYIEKVLQAFHKPEIPTSAVYTVEVPMPAPEERLTMKLQRRCEELLHAEEPSGCALSYTRSPRLHIPAELVSVSTDTNTISLDFGGQRWWTALRLLSDREVDEKDADGNTLLHLGAQAGDLQVVTFAVQAGASLTQSNNLHLTPPQTAVIAHRSSKEFQGGQCANFQQLLAATEEDEQEKTKVMLCFNFFPRSPLLEACQEGLEDVASLLLQLGCDVNAKEYCNDRRSECRDTPLHYACLKGHRNIVELLIRHQADVNIVSSSGHETALHWACKTDSLSSCEYICRLLVDSGAEVNAVNPNTGITPLHEACSRNDRNTAAMLIQRGAEVNVKDHAFGFTPLHHACLRSHTDVVQLLVNERAEVNPRDSENLTPIFYAYTNHSADIIRVLEQNGAELDVLHKAAIRGDTKALAVFSQYGFDMNTKDRILQCCPLHVACIMNDIPTVACLLELGADVNAQDGAQLWSTPETYAMSLYTACRAGWPELTQTLNRLGTEVSALGGMKALPMPKANSTPLYNACKAGHLEIVQTLINHGANVNSEDCPLYAACSVRQTEIAHHLIEHGASVNEKKYSHTALHYVCREGFTDVAQFLLEHGADINVRDNGLQTPLHYACISGKLDTASLLIESGADVDVVDQDNCTPLYCSVDFANYDVSKLLIQRGADLNVSSTLPDKALHISVRQNFWRKKELTEISLFLIEHGADVNSVDYDSLTPLHNACHNGDTETVLSLIRHGAQVEAKNEDGQTPLHKACRGDIVQVLIDHGADVNAVTRDGELPVHLASQRGDADSLDMLAHHGADVNARNTLSGESPLHLASCPEIVMRLAELGADLDARDGQSRTLLHTAQHVDISRVLVSQGADVNAVDEEFSSPLHCSCENTDVAKVLLVHGANVNAVDKYGRTALYRLCLFSRYHHEASLDAALLLIKHGACVNVMDTSGDTMLQHVQSGGFTELAHLLLCHGAHDTSVRVTDASGAGMLPCDMSAGVTASLA